MAVSLTLNACKLHDTWRPVTSRARPARRLVIPRDRPSARVAPHFHAPTLGHVTRFYRAFYVFHDVQDIYFLRSYSNVGLNAAARVWQQTKIDGQTGLLVPASDFRGPGQARSAWGISQPKRLDERMAGFETHLCDRGWPLSAKCLAHV
jgi:hypothetical protein